MKFIKGFIAGALVGFGLGSAVNERQREQVLARIRKQAAPVRDAVTENAQQVADAATEAGAGAVDRAGAAATEKVSEVGDAIAGGTSAHAGAPPSAVGAR